MEIRVAEIGLARILIVAICLAQIGCSAFQEGYRQAEYEGALKELGYLPVEETALNAVWPGTIATQNSHLSKSSQSLLVCPSADLLRKAPDRSPVDSTVLRKQLNKRLIVNKFFSQSQPSEVALHTLNLYDQSFRFVNVYLSSVSSYTEDLAAAIASRDQLNTECVGAIKHLHASGEELVVIVRTLVASVTYSLAYVRPKDSTTRLEETPDVIKLLAPKLPPGALYKLEPDGTITVTLDTAVGTATVPLKTLGWDLG